MRYIEEYLNDVIKVKPLGELTTKDDELNGMSGEMVYIDGKCSDIFISHADYANWLEKRGEQSSKSAQNGCRTSDIEEEVNKSDDYKKGFECGKQRVLKYPEDFGLRNPVECTEEDEKQKYDFVSGNFLQCLYPFNVFKEGEHYWFDYIGNNTYIGRSDNILNQRFIINPRRLYSSFSQQLQEKQGEQKNIYTKQQLRDMGFAFDSNGDIVTPDVINEAIKEYLANEKKKWEKEQKPADKVEPKFKVGDWIIHNKNIELANSLMLVTGKDNNEYLCKDINGQCSYNIEFIDKDYHLWTIQDAKDGDVLVEDSCIFIIEKLNHDHTAETYCELHNDGCFDDCSSLCFDIDSTKPATKEQRDLLFSKMKEAGYEWDGENKELKKTEPRHPECPEEDATMSYSKELEAKLREACARYYSNGSDTISLAGVFYAGVEAQKDIEKNQEWSKDLELASERYACKVSNSKYGNDKIKDAVVWGANWQKEQMLKDAVEEEVFDGSFAEQVGELPVIQYAITPDDNLKIGDKVKLVIIK